MRISNKESILSFVNSKIGEEQSAEDAEDGPPELLVSSLQGEVSHAGWALSVIQPLKARTSQASSQRWSQNGSQAVAAIQL